MSSWNSQLSRLFIEHRKALMAFVTRRTGNRQLAADLTQETFLRLMRLEQGRQLENVQGYLFTIAGNLVRDHQRQLARRERHEGEMPEEEPASQVPTVVEALAQRQEQKLMQDAINALPDLTRQIFLCYHVEGQSYRDIAAQLDISPRSVEYHLRKALVDCRSYIKSSLAGRRPASHEAGHDL